MKSNLLAAGSICKFALPLAASLLTSGCLNFVPQLSATETAEAQVARERKSRVSTESPQQTAQSNVGVASPAMKAAAQSIESPHEIVVSRSTEALGSNQARILMRSTGMPMSVDYSVGAAEQSCKEMKNIGTVRDKGEKVLLSWIVKLSEKLNTVPDQIETVVPAGQSVQVAGFGHWYDSNSKGNCGPVITSFTPAEQHTYLVQFVWQGTARCMSRVVDVTEPATWVPVPAQPKICPRSFVDIWLGRSGL